MSNLRLFLLLGLALVGLQLWSAWQQDYGPKPETPVSSETVPGGSGDAVPTAEPAVAGDEIPEAPSEAPVTGAPAIVMLPPALWRALRSMTRS